MYHPPMIARTAALAFALCALACAPPAPPRPPTPDASFDANLDARLTVVEVGPRPDVPLDAPAVDAAGLDAADGRADAGAELVTVDGRLVEPAWTSALGTTTDVMARGSFAACALSELFVVPGESSLWLGVRGDLDPSCNAAIVVYLDVDPSGDAGLLLDGGGGADTTGNLDRVISGPLSSLIRPDFAWGTRAMPLSRSVGTGDTGWRRIAVAPFTLPTGQVTVCTATECETSIPYASLGLAPGAQTVQLFARLGDGDFWADPTLPAETPAEFVATALAVDLVVP